MEAVDVLREARELIAIGEMPVQRADALDELGRRCYPTETRANRWSITGALLKAGREADGDVFLAALSAVAGAVGVEATNETRLLCQRLWEWEDRPGRTTEHVLAAFARAEEGVDRGK